MITVFGSINIDIATRVAVLPKPGETVMGDAYQTAPGGKGGNQALAARRMGARVRFVGAVGRDAFAEAALELLREGGVDLTAVRRSAAMPTGLAMIAFDEKGENQIVVAPGANAEVSAEDIPEEALDRWTLLLLQMELRPSEVTRAIAKAREAEARVVLNFAPAVPLAESALDAVDVLILNLSEAALMARGFALSAAKPAGLAGAIAERRGRPVVLTGGEQGAWVATSRFGVEHVAAPQVPVQDTTGAGDALVGTVAAGLDIGMPLIEAVRRGVVAGSLSCTRFGAQPSLPTAAELDAAMGS